MQTYLKNGYIVSMDQQDTVFDGGGVLVEDDRITAVGKVDPRLVKPDAEVIDLQGRYVLPGFVNTHVHTSQQISRGVGDDVDFICWLHDRMWPFESSMTEEDSYVSTLMTSLELIRSGVTSFAEPGGQFVSGMARGTAESGLRGKLAKSVMDCGDGLIEMVNPEIIETEGEQDGPEGCLSVPGRRGMVKRPMKVRARFQDRNGEWYEIEAEELLARCIMHETDHLDGQLYVDIMSRELFDEDDPQDEETEDSKA